MNKISIEVSVNAPIKLVWDCWTKPEHITQWNFANDAWACPSAINVLQEGSTFSWRMEAKDGSMGFDFEGVYTEIIPNKHISYRMTDGRQVDISFRPTGQGIEIAESFEAEGSHTDELQRAGWQAILSNFKAYTESLE